jgi:hypothetical protein
MEVMNLLVTPLVASSVAIRSTGGGDAIAYC